MLILTRRINKFPYIEKIIGGNLAYIFPFNKIGISYNRFALIKKKLLSCR